MVKIKNNRLQVIGIPTKSGKVIYLKVGEECEIPENEIDLGYLKQIHLSYKIEPQKYEICGDNSVVSSVVEKAEKKVELLKTKKVKRKKLEDKEA